jgi:signal transduction histidine kinase
MSGARQAPLFHVNGTFDTFRFIVALREMARKLAIDQEKNRLAENIVSFISFIRKILRRIETGTEHGPPDDQRIG